MTNPFALPSFPGDPTLPSKAPSGYVTPAAIASGNKSPVTSQQIEVWRGGFLEMILRAVVEALDGSFLPGLGDAFEQLVAFGKRLSDIFSNLAALFGITDADLDGDIDVQDVWAAVVATFIQPIIDIFNGVRDALTSILGPIFGGLDFSALPSPAEIWEGIVNLFMLPLNIFSIPADVQASIGVAIGHVQDALDGTYAGSDPIFLAVQALAAQWLNGSSPLDMGNAFGKLLPRNISGLGLSSLTTQVENLMENFISAQSVPTSDGWSFDSTVGTPGSAKVIADGTTKTLYSPDLIQVNDDVDTSMDVQYTGITSGAGPTIHYILELFADADGLVPFSTPKQEWSVSGPTGSSGPVTLGDSSWTPPSGVVSVLPLVRVDAAVTAGSVNFHTPRFFKVLDPTLAGGLPAAIQARIDALQDTWNAFKGGTGGGIADIVARIQHITLTGSFDAANLANVTGTASQSVISGLPALDSAFGMLRDILGGAPTAPPPGGLQDVKDWWTSVGSTFTEMQGVFAGEPVDPTQPLPTITKGWWDTFFAGGPRNVVTQAQIADVSGIPPLDANVTIPKEYLGPDFVPVLLGHPQIEVAKVGDQPITPSTDTLITGLTQSGPATLTISGGKFKFPFDGLWNLEIAVRWSGVGALEQPKINLKQNDVLIREDVVPGIDRNTIQTMIPAATTDEFSVYAFTAASSRSVTAANTYIRATYMGATTVPSLPPPLPPVTFDAAGGGDSGSGTQLQWLQSFGPDAKTIVIPISHQWAVSSVTVGSHTVPILSGNTYVGSYTGFHAYCSLAAAILPDSVKGTAQTVTVNFATSSAGSANSMTFNGVGSIGDVITSSGGSAPKLNVPSNVSSMVAVGFGGVDGNFSGFNRTQVNNFPFIAFGSWAHLIGYAVGGQAFSAAGGRWAGKGIELHP